MLNSTLNQNIDDLSSSVTFCSWMSACPKPLSINIVEKARKMDIILTSPNSEGGTIWAIRKVHKTCIPVFEKRSTMLHSVLYSVLFPFIRYTI